MTAGSAQTLRLSLIEGQHGVKSWGLGQWNSLDAGPYQKDHPPPRRIEIQPSGGIYYLHFGFIKKVPITLKELKVSFQV